MAIGFKKLSYGDSFDSSKYDTTEVIDSKLQKKVDKVDGKGLSSNDLTNELLQLLQDKYTKEEANKLVNDLDTDLQKQIDDIKLILSTDDVDFDTLQELVNVLKNNVASINDIFTALSQKASKNDLPTKVSDLENDLGYLTQHQDISGKAEKTYVDEELQKKVDKTNLKALAYKDSLTKSDIGLGNVLNVESYSKTESDNKFITEENLSEFPKMLQATFYIPLFVSGDLETADDEYAKSFILQLKNILGDSIKKKGYAQLEAKVGLYDSDSGSKLYSTGLKQKEENRFYGTVHDRVEIILSHYDSSFQVSFYVFSEDGNIPLEMHATLRDDGSFSRKFEDINGDELTFEEADSLYILSSLSINGFLILYQED